MNTQKIVGTQMIEKSMNGEDFYGFIKTKLAPRLRKGQVVGLDNKLYEYEI